MAGEPITPPPRRRKSDLLPNDDDAVRAELRELRDMIVATGATLQTHLKSCEVRGELMTGQQAETNRRFQEMKEGRQERDKVVDGRFDTLADAMGETRDELIGMRKGVGRVGLAILLMTISVMGAAVGPKVAQWVKEPPSTVILK